MFTYAAIERILATLHFQPPRRIPAFRARLKYLKRLGVPTIQGPGSGNRIIYSREHLYQMAFCLELEAFGMDPTVAAAVGRHRWRKVYEGAFKKAERQSKIDPDRHNDFFLVITPEFVAFSDELEVQGNVDIRGCVRSDLVATEIERMTDKAGAHTRRKCLLNVSDLLHRINELAEGAEL